MRRALSPAQPPPRPAAPDLEAEIAPLAEPLRAWVRSQGWPALRPIQREAVPALLAEPFEQSDFLLSASTASGKTEAALLPLLTRIYRRSEPARPSFEILYVSPLKALINEMAVRVGAMAQGIHRRAYRRHGDVSDKERAGSRGILLTTPESLEAQFIRSPENVAFLFADLQAVIVDEVHAYFESPRGPQLVSLLARLEAVLAEQRGVPECWIPRVGLSATLGGGGGDESLRSFLRPGRPDRVRVLCPSSLDNRVDVHLKVFLEPGRDREASPKTPPRHQPLEKHHGDLPERSAPPPGVREIARNLFEVFSRCEKGLIFTNSRREAEDYADLLNEMAREEGLVGRPRPADGAAAAGGHSGELDAEFAPETRLFWPHHGSLDAWLRSRAEKVMRDEGTRSVLVCTTTLELGIDVGTVEATAQVGAGFSVASLRQRLGRSGRREGMTPTLHAYVRESELGADADPVERLHLKTFRTLAQICLLEQGVFEPPDSRRLNLSTLIQQLLSSAQQHQGDQGLDPAFARSLLIDRGPFRSAGEILAPLVTHLSRKYNPPLEEQDGRLFLTEYGRKYVWNHSFYAAFATPQEYAVRAGARRIGAFAPRYPYGPGDQFLFGGTCWEVLRVDHARRVLEVTRTASGRAPQFEGDALAPSDLVVREMRSLYGSARTPKLPPRTNPAARRVVEDGRAAYRKLLAERSRIIPYGPGSILFPWVGTRKQITLISALKWMGLPAAAMDVAVLVRDVSPAHVLAEMERFLREPLPNEHDLARYGSRLTFEKHDYLLSPALKRMNFASAKLDLASLRGTIESLLAREE